MRNSLLIMAVLFGACSADAPIPDGVLDQERFTDVLLETTLLEARMNRELVTEQRGSIPMDRYYGDLFAKKSVSRTEFERSFDFYAAHPDRMAAIYEEVLVRLSRRKDEALQRPVVPLVNADTLDIISSSERKR